MLCMQYTQMYCDRQGKYLYGNTNAYNGHHLLWLAMILTLLSKFTSGCKLQLQLPQGRRRDELCPQLSLATFHEAHC